MGLVGEYHHLPALKQCQYAEAAAVCDINDEKAKAMAERFSIPRYFTNYEQVLADESIDAVLIATPNFLHKAQAIAAAKAGKHVLVEKPMALNLNECREMIDACENASVTLMVAHHLRFKDCAVA